MRPLIFGRVLGTGLRVAGRIVMDLATAPAPSSPSAPAQPHTPPSTRPGPGKVSGQTTGSLKQGIKALLTPIGRATSIVWLQVTGLFFFLPVLAFAPKLWLLRANWLHGPEHKTFLLCAGVVGLFFYLGVSSFWRAARK